MNITHAATSSKKNLITKRAITIMTKENVTSQLNSLLLYSLMKRARDLASICDHAEISFPWQAPHTPFQNSGYSEEIQH
ncbi:Os07g0181750 [Oryza sativa Japonica Group]|uniref:Os07g0181750 protein n=1 Tax=Oryza sativa subsp. japonica TaxID=39947 RepID=A0A0P0X3F4_ORYSJ|nr:hypothetical protein EE612_037505 [Oryza sativa]BAT00327.1 Os07g0181750 [Oryza sativa Japonica Group]